MDYDLIVRGANIDVAVAETLIAGVAPPGTLAGSAVEEIDASRLYIAPGGIDAHVHCNEPGRTDWEGFATATAALAAGGFTAFLDMPLNSSPPTVDVTGFDAKLACAERSAIIDYGLWGGLVPGNLAQLEPLHERGVIGFKAFMCETGIPDFRPVDDAIMWEGMREIAALGSILAVHAENDPITTALTAAALGRGAVDARAYLASRPPVVELEAISRAIALATDTGCRLHIVHVSTADGVALIQAARQRGIDVSWETTPHHLALTADDVAQIGTLAKCSPVMHDRQNQASLWKLVRSDPTAIVASDHSPAPMSLKQGDDFFAAWGGISGAQSSRGVLFRGVGDGLLSLDSAIAATSSNPAARFGLGNKGTIAIGRDADLCAIDLAQTWELTPTELRYRHPQSALTGSLIAGSVRHVLARGDWLIHHEQLNTQHRGTLLTATGQHGSG